MFIYKIENKINKKVYIGSTKNYEVRKKEHIKKLKSKTHPSKRLGSDFEKFGIDNLDFSVITEVDTKDYRQVEEMYINKYKSFDPEFGYNITHKSKGGNSSNCMVAIYSKNGQLEKIVPSIRTILQYDKGVYLNIKYNDASIKLIVNKKGYGYKRVSSINQALEKIEVDYTKGYFNYTKKKEILVVDANTLKIVNRIKPHENLCNLTNLDRVDIVVRCLGMWLYDDKYYFCYSEDFNKLIEAKNEKVHICVFNCEGNFISNHTSVAECAREYSLNKSIAGVSRANTNNLFKKKLRQYKGFIFKYYKYNEIPKKICVITGSTLI